MKVDVVGKTKIYNKDKLVAESNYHGHAFASGKFEITEQQANKARMLRNILVDILKCGTYWLISYGAIL